VNRGPGTGIRGAGPKQVVIIYDLSVSLGWTRVEGEIWYDREGVREVFIFQFLGDWFGKILVSCLGAGVGAINYSLSFMAVFLLVFFFY